MSALDYTLIGHVCIDELDDGTDRLGGTVHFAAGQALALGCEVRVITSATARLAQRLFDAHDGAIELDLRESDGDTCFGFDPTADDGPARLLSAAAPIDAGAVAMLLAAADRGTVHLGPIAGELGPGVVEMARAGSDYLGITPQGMLRAFAEDGSFVVDPSGWHDAVLSADALVLNDGEYRRVDQLGLLAGYDGLVFRTLGRDGALVMRGGTVLAQYASALGGHLEGANDRPRPVNPDRTIGAGDVFAAAAFIAHAAGESPADALEVAVELASHWVHRDSETPCWFGIDS
ncbi:MAG TPA: hypothetical protein PLP95_08635 [Microthrixaceae bacterium]|nr:hypothetical protein [Microthrixaceae bacterium]